MVQLAVEIAARAMGEAGPPPWRPHSAVLLLILTATPSALADPPPLARPAPIVLALPAPASVPVAPALTEAEKAALVIAGINAGLAQAQAGIQAAPILKPWTETKAGQIVMGCIAGAIVVTSAAGATDGNIVALK